MKLKSKKKKGFTLSEIVITFALALALIMGISSMVISGLKINSDSGEKQSGNQYAQQLLEKLVSQDIEKSLSGDKTNGYTLNFGNVVFNSNNKNEFSVSDYSLDSFNITDTEKLSSGYKADITITRNSSGIGTSINGESIETTSNEYTLYITGEGENAFINSEDDISSEGEALSLNGNELDINVDIKKNEKEKVLKVNQTLSKTFTEDESIRLNLDFSNYDINSKDIKFNVTINNKDDKSLNLCLQESGNLNTEKYVNVEAKKGKVLIYDNRSSEDSRAKDKMNLYDIAIKIKNNTDVIYEKTISRNLSISDNTN